MDSREQMIAHMPEEARRLMRQFFAELEKIDIDLGLQPLPADAAAALDERWKRRPPRDEREMHERLDARWQCQKPVMQHITNLMAMFPAPVVIMNAHIDGQA